MMLQQKRVATTASALLLFLISLLVYSLSFARQLSVSSNVGPSTSAETDWSRFAYVQYATSLPYLCNSVMLFGRLHQLGSKADRVLLHSSIFSPDGQDIPGTLLRDARDKYGAILKPIEVLSRDSLDPTWAESFTKLLAFNQTEYDRVLHLDSDSTILRSMDELFLLPSAVAAMPRSYWEPQEPHIKLSSQLLLVMPSSHEFQRCLAAVQAADRNAYDMEIVNHLYGDTALVLPYDIYDLYTGEFRGGPDHKNFLGDLGAVWNPDKAVERAKFVHFSDWPLPKPWITAEQGLWEESMPKCFGEDGVEIKEPCRERELWIWFYEDFKARRTQVCGSEV